MRKMEKWLNLHMEEPVTSLQEMYHRGRELYNIGRELDRNEVSVKVCNVYPITYGLMANVTSLK